MGERDGEGLPWVYETAKMKICDIANGWKDKNLHFGVLFLRNLILIVKWQREVSERKVRNQVLSVHFLPLQEQGASVLVPHPLVPQHLPVKWELLNLPLNAKFYHVCKNWGPSRGKQSIQPHMPPCAPQECQWWHPVEQSRAGAWNGATEEKGPLPAPDHLVMAAAKVGAGVLHSPPCFAFEKFFFPPTPKISCFILLDQSLSVSRSMNVLRRTGPSVPWLCSSGTALWSLGADCATAPGAQWAWAGSSQPLSVSLTFLQCQVPVSASMFPTQGTGQPWQGLLGSDRALWHKSQWDRATDRQGWLWERMSSVTDQAADRS